MRNINGADAVTSFVEEMASRIEDLKVILTAEANSRRETCKLDAGDGIDYSSHAHVVVVDSSPIPAIYNKDLVGLDGPREELVGWLTDPQPKLKVVSIVGSAGSGKTTLAMQVYTEIEAQFDRTTFVSASRRPDVESLLGGLLLNLGTLEFPRTLELHEIIDRLREDLEDKRYDVFLHFSLICLRCFLSSCVICEKFII
jgi:hypothetical protein